MTTLVTGATGAIGAHLAKRLSEKGENVVGIVHDTHPKETDTLELLNASNSIHLAYGDITDLSFIKRVVSDYEVNKIFHFAALPIVKVGNMSPLPTLKTNVEGAWNVMEAARENNASVLYFSTDKVYGDQGNRPIKESAALNGANIYDVSKAMADQISRAYNFVFGIKVAVSRSCNIYGPADLNSRLIPNTIRNCLMGESPVIFDGVDHVREWIYVDDVINAVIMLMDNIDKASGQAWNIGTGFTATQNTVIQEILKHFPNLKPKIVPAPPHTRTEIPYQQLDIEKITKTFYWRSCVTFEDGIKRTVDWWKDHKELVRFKNK